MKDRAFFLKIAGSILTGFLMLGVTVNTAFASDDGAYVTISVEAEDDNEGLTYTEKILDKIACGSTQAIRLSERNSIVADALLKFVSFVVGRDV